MQYHDMYSKVIKFYVQNCLCFEYNKSYGEQDYANEEYPSRKQSTPIWYYQTKI